MVGILHWVHFPQCASFCINRPDTVQRYEISIPNLTMVRKFNALFLMFFFLWSFFRLVSLHGISIESVILPVCWGSCKNLHQKDIRAWFYHACLKTTCYRYRWLHFPAYMYEFHLTIFFLWIYFHNCCLSQISHMVDVLLTHSWWNVGECKCWIYWMDLNKKFTT